VAVAAVAEVRHPAQVDLVVVAQVFRPGHQVQLLEQLILEAAEVVMVTQIQDHLVQVVQES
jgi:hypothetical protein